MSLLPRLVLLAAWPALLTTFSLGAAAQEAAAPSRVFAAAPESQAWTRNAAIAVGVPSLVAGVVLLPAGVFTFIGGNEHCEDANCEKPGLKVAGVVMMVAGGVSVIGGTVVLATMPAKRAEPPAQATLALRPGGADVRLTF